MADENAPSPISPVEPSRCREFRLSDAMILLAGLVLSLSMGAYLFLFLAERLSENNSFCRASGLLEQTLMQFARMNSS